MNHHHLRLQLSAILEALREKEELADFQIAARWGIPAGTLTVWQDTERNWRTGTAEKIQAIVDDEISKGTLLERRSAP